MAPDSKSSDPLDLELPEGFDEDIEDDWESAFRAEDFMLPLDEDADETAAKADTEMDLASLLETDETQVKKQPGSGSLDEKTVTGPELSETPFPTEPLASLFDRSKLWFSRLPLHQKLLLPSSILFVVLFVTAVLFFKSTSDQLTQQGEEAPAASTETAKEETPLATELAAVVEKIEEPPPAPPIQIRKKWNLPAFLITAEDKTTQEKIVIKVDISLILLLEPGQSIPEEKKIFIRDTIYQFYINRPVADLHTYPLARGEMIRKLNAWLNKEWPDNPITSVIFNHFQIIS